MTKFEMNFKLDDDIKDDKLIEKQKEFEKEFAVEFFNKLKDDLKLSFVDQIIQVPYKNTETNNIILKDVRVITLSCNLPFINSNKQYDDVLFKKVDPKPIYNNTKLKSAEGDK